jgi:hypothetical protein
MEKYAYTETGIDVDTRGVFLGILTLSICRSFTWGH